MSLPLKYVNLVNSLVVQWLGHHIFTAKALGLIPVKELRFHKPYHMAQKNNNNKNNKECEFSSNFKLLNPTQSLPVINPVNSLTVDLQPLT